MGFQCGIVGLPNVGKSTLFNALTKAGIDAQNYPFCTIEPNVGMVPMPDSRLDTLANIVKPQKVIPTTMCFVDIAGLVKGAAQGEGLGNQFLANIREMDAIAHVIRCFEDDDIVHVAGAINPLEDIDTIHLELILADLDTVSKAAEKTHKLARTGNKEAQSTLEYLNGLKTHLDAGRLAKDYPETHDVLSSLHLLTLKPMMLIANVDESGFHDNPRLDTVREYAKQNNMPVVPICAAIESELSELSDAERDDFLAEYGLTEPGLHRLIHEGYTLLNLHTYFTAGEKEVRAWTLPIGSTAPEAAGKIHTDFQKGFIRAEVIGFEDYVRYQGESGAKEAGKWRLEGKEYVVVDGDVIHFRFNV